MQHTARLVDVAAFQRQPLCRPQPASLKVRNLQHFRRLKRMDRADPG
jgi:hypothetical protein